MKKLLKYLKPYTWPIIALFVFTFGQSLASLSLPEFMAKIINHGIIEQNNSLILRYGLIMLLLSLVGGALTMVIAYMSTKVGTRFAKEIRTKLFSKIENFSMIEFNKFSTASLITRNTNDIQQIQTALIMMLRMALMAPFVAAIAIWKAYKLAPGISWILTLAIIILVLFISLIFRVVIPRFKRVQELLDKLNLISRESLRGLRVIRAFRKEKFEEERFESTNLDLKKTNIFVNRVLAIMHPGMHFLLDLSILALAWFGAKQVDLSGLPIGNLIAFMQYAMQAIFSFQMIAMIFVIIPRVSVSANRIIEVLETKESIKDPEHGKQLDNPKGRLEFKNVSFSYPEAKEAVLENISFLAEPGKITAIIGSTGSGKSSIAYLIPRLYEASAGEISIDGLAIKEMEQKYLRSLISYASQKALLLSGDIKENISYSDPSMKMERIKESAKVAQVSQFIESLDEDFSSSVAQAGANFSGGQKQRLAIARALAKEAKIYIFDDSFSALDFKTDQILRQELKESLKDKTVLIIAQRINTIIDADNIIVLDSGKIASQGKHEELLKKSKLYQEIAKSQLSEEELSSI